jgi:hypothetical protein
MLQRNTTLAFFLVTLVLLAASLLFAAVREGEGGQGRGGGQRGEVIPALNSKTFV